MSKSKAQLEAELKMLRASKTAEGWITIGQSAIRWTAIVFIVRYAYLAIEILSGKSTTADIGINFLANINISVALAWCAALGGIAYGKHQSKLRKDTVERLQDRIQELESDYDQSRSSSNLTPRGETRPEDRL